MPRWLRITVRTFVSFLAVILLAWAGLGIYIRTHNQEILQKITVSLSEQVQGKLAIRDMQPSLWTSFPHVEVALRDVTLRDSLFEVHHHSLIDVKYLYIKLNIFALLSHKVEIMKLTGAHGSAFVYVDSTGYSNTYLMARRDTTKKNRTALLDRFGVQDVHFYFINYQKNKDFHLYISSLDGAASQKGSIIHFKMAAAIHVYSFAFSTLRGSYLRNQDLRIDGPFEYHIDKKELDIPEQVLRISKEEVFTSGRFYFNRVPAAFELHMYSDAVTDKEAKTWVSPNISRVAAPYSFARPIGIRADVSGIMQYHSIPLIRVVLTIKDNTLNTPVGAIEKFTAIGQYYNEAITGRGHGDDNSEVRFTAIRGSWQNLPFEGDTVSVTNLLVPYINAHMKSAFPLPKLNAILGGETFSFNKGEATADLHYRGGIIADDPTPYSLNGFMQLTDASATYLPRNLAFSDVGARLLFQNDNLFIRDVTLRTHASSLHMEGEAYHFLHLYFSDPGKILVSWRARSSQIDLNEFRGFAGKRKYVVEAHTKRPAAISRIGRQLDRVLAASSFTLDAKVDKLIFRRFLATAVIAKAILDQNGIVLQQVGLSHAGGSLAITGVIHQQEKQNPFQIKAVLHNVDVSGVFNSFENFGQQAISSENLRGKLNAVASITGGMTEDGRVIGNSLNGTVKFKLEDGELNNFSPFAKISKYIFKKRSFDHVSFKDLESQLDINGSKITIHPLDIQTSAINMQVAGVYSLTPTGTDIAIQIPLRNPAKDKARSPLGKLLRRTGKGFVIHLRAQDGGTNGVKIGWDPLHKGERALSDSLKLD